jgi:hypothetical protein
MAIARNLFAVSTAGTSTLTISPSFIGSPVIRGCLVFVVQEGATDEVSSVVRDSVSFARISSTRMSKATGEACSVYAYFDATAGLSGDITVSVSGASNKVAGAHFFTANTPVVVRDEDRSVNGDSVENPSGTVDPGGLTSFVALAGFTGLNNMSNIAPLTGWTSDHEEDFGADGAVFYSYDTVGKVPVTFGWTAGADDAVIWAVAVAEQVDLQSETTDCLTAAARKLSGVKTEREEAQHCLAKAVATEIAALGHAFGNTATDSLYEEAQEALDRAKRGEQGIITEKSVPAVERVRAVCYEIAKLAANI